MDSIEPYDSRDVSNWGMYGDSSYAKCGNSPVASSVEAEISALGQAYQTPRCVATASPPPNLRTKDDLEEYFRYLRNTGYTFIWYMTWSRDSHALCDHVSAGGSFDPSHEMFGLLKK